MEAAPLIVDVERLARGGERFVGEIPAAALDLPPADAALFAARGNLRYDLRVEQLGEELLVRGRVEQDFRCTCVRCAGGFDWTSRDAEVTFAVQPGEQTFVDLTPELREGILIQLPNHPLCRTECRGLCPVCGADLNRGPCGCKPPSDARWGTLDGLGDSRTSGG